MNETKVVNVGQLTASVVKFKLTEYRELVVKEGNANLLNELDKIIEIAEQKSLPLEQQKFMVPEMILGFLFLVGVILTPWVYGIVQFVKNLF